MDSLCELNFSNAQGETRELQCLLEVGIPLQAVIVHLGFACELEVLQPRKRDNAEGRHFGKKKRAKTSKSAKRS